MLKIRIALVALIATYFVLYGCGGGGGAEVNLDAQARADLAGTWRVVQAGQPGMPTVTCPGVIVIGNGPPIPCTANFTVTLRPDGTYTAFDGSTGTWSVHQNRLTAVSGQTTLGGNLEFHNENAVTVRDDQGRFFLMERVS